MQHLIQRPRLAGQVLSPGSNKNTVIRAGAGYGKSALLTQLVDFTDLRVLVTASAGTDSLQTRISLSLARQMQGGQHWIELADTNTGAFAQSLAAEFDVVAVDDAHKLGSDENRLISALAVRGVRVVLAARHLPPDLASMVADNEWTVIDASALAFTVEETQQLLDQASVDADDAAETIHGLTDGWPAALEQAIDQISASGYRDGVAALLREGSVVSRLVDHHLRQLDTADQIAVRGLSDLPFFDAEIAELMAAPGLLDRLELVGLSLIDRPDGWDEFAHRGNAVHSQPDIQAPPLARAVVDRFVDAGKLHPAITACLTAGDYSMAAEVVAAFTPEQEAQLDVDRLNAAMTTIGDAASTSPRSLYIQAHVHAINARSGEGLQYLERGTREFTLIDPDLQDHDHLEMLLALATWRVYDGLLEDAWDIHNQCEQAVRDCGDLALLGRLHDTRGVLFHAAASDADLKRATEELTAALAIWRKLRRPREAFVTVGRLATVVLPSRGKRLDALAIIEELPAVGPMAPMDAARIGIERARILPFVGRADEVVGALREPRRVAKLMKNDWLLLTALEAEIVAASMLSQRELVDELATDFVGSADFGDLTTSLMYCDVIEALARCGNTKAAEAGIRLIQDTHGIDPWIQDYYRGSVAIRCGRPAEGIDLLERLEVEEGVEPEKRWMIDLLQAYGHLQLSSPEAATKYFDEAKTKAAQLGVSDLPSIVEKTIVAYLRDIVEDPHHTLPTKTEISVFESFSVRIGGQNMRVPAGQTRALLKVLVLGIQPLVIDQVIDPLWPDADLSLGRRRLRNVIKRVRESCGDIIVRNGDMLQLDPSVYTDFGAAVAAASDAVESRDLHVLAAAIALNDRALLPEDRYEEFAEDSRSEHRARVVALHDVHAALAETLGEIDLAVRSLLRADELDPLPSQRASHASSLLRAVGRITEAEVVEDR